MSGKPVRQQLDSLKFGNELLQTADLPVICGRVQFQLEKYEQTINNKQYQLNNSISASQPSVIVQPNPFQPQPKFNFYKPAKVPSLHLPTQSSQQVIKNHQFVEQIIRDKYQIQSTTRSSERSEWYKENGENKRYGSSFKASRSKGLTVGGKSMADKSQMIVGKPVFSRMFNAPVILDKRHRNDPFYDIPSVSEGEFKKGLNYLLNKGIIPKDYDLTPAFEKGHPPIQKAQIKLQPFKTKFDPRPSAHLMDYTQIEQINLENLQRNMNMQIQDTNVFLTGGHIEGQDDLQKMKFSYKSKNMLKDSEQQEENQMARTTGLKHSLMQSKRGQYMMTTKIGRQLMEHPPNIQVLIQQYHEQPLKLTIYMYKLQTDSSEYKSFKQMNYANWKRVQAIITQLEDILHEYKLPKSIMDGYKVSALSLYQTKVSFDDLISCLDNHLIITNIYQNIKKKIQCVRPQVIKNWAIIFIQKIMRALKNKEKYAEMLQKQNAGNFMKICYILTRYKRIMLKHINKQNEVQKEVVNELNKKFRSQWKDIKHEKRIEIHINSFSYDEFQRKTSENIQQKKNSQIIRLFTLKDPNVQVIIIIPKNYSQELINYYHKIMELGRISNFKQRCTFIPISLPKSMKSLSLIDQFYYDSVSIRKVQTMIQNQTSYLVTGYPSLTEYKLAYQLKVPIFSGSPTNRQAFNSHLGAKQIMNECGIPVPPGSNQLIINIDSLYDKLITLMFDNQVIDTWRLKIANENHGRGIALFTFNTRKFIQELSYNLQEQEQKEATVSSTLFTRFSSHIRRIFINSLKPLCVSLFPTSNDYLSRFFLQKGIIEACPNNHNNRSLQLSFLIQPDGDIIQLGMFDKHSGEQSTNRIGVYGQTQIKQLEGKQLSTAVGNYLYSQGVQGHMSIDLITFYPQDVHQYIFDQDHSIKGKQDTSSQQHTQLDDHDLSLTYFEQGGSQLFWAIDMDIYLNDYSANLLYFDFLMEGAIKPDLSYEVSIELKKEKRVFMVMPYLCHTALSQFSFAHFFQLCRSEQIAYDCRTKTGTTFILMDDLRAQTIGILTIANNHNECARMMQKNMEFLNKYQGKDLKKNIEPHDQWTFQEALGTIRSIKRHYENTLQDYTSFI